MKLVPLNGDGWRAPFDLEASIEAVAGFADKGEFIMADNGTDDRCELLASKSSTLEDSTPEAGVALLLKKDVIVLPGVLACFTSVERVEELGEVG